MMTTSPNHTMRLGVDTGGTFTDFFWLDHAGELHIYKQLSTPHDPSEAILDGIAHLDIPTHTQIVHGSTVATNALLERRGARTALITTQGFADVLAIGRQNRPDLYALVPQKQEPLVPRHWRMEINERVNAGGEVVTPLKLADVDAVIDRLAEAGIDAVAVCLLFSFLYPAHEQRIRERILERLGDRHQGERQQGPPHISLSSDVLPEYREFERTSTTVINAYVAPLMARYLKRLTERVAPRSLTVMQSNGGIIQARTAGDQAARTVLSGPAGGVVGAMHVASQAGLDQIISFDMGGTSTDVALCPGRLPTTARGEVAGMPLRLPIIDIHTVGAGGGSLSYVDAGGALHVGPESAGADPGPACYGQGNQAATTDANLVLGRLDAANFLGGKMKLDVKAARMALSELAVAMGVSSPEAAAWGVLQVANATMERAIRRISVERGYDPRTFTLIAFGGAGPLHACDLASSLNIPRVLVPLYPGVLSAVGMLVAPPSKDYSQTVMWPVEPSSMQRLEAALQTIQEQATSDMASEHYQSDQLAWHRSLDMRYRGQSHELTIPLPDDNSAERLARDFDEAHLRRFGYCQPAAAREIVTLRLAVTAPVAPVNWSVPIADTTGSTLVGRKPIWFSASGATDTALYRREKLAPDTSFDGPALVLQYDTTTVIPPGWSARVDRWGNILLDSS